MKLSVLVLTYNHADFIEQTLESIINQTTKFDFEILVYDDASSDDTQSILKKYARTHKKKIRLFIQKHNRYQRGERGLLIKYLLPYAIGDYISLCEGDDYFSDTNKLQTSVDFLDKNLEFSLVFHPVNIMQDNGEITGVFPSTSRPEFFTLEHLLKENFIQTNSVTYRRTDYKQLTSLNIMPADWYLHIYHARIGRIGFIDKAMSVYRKHPQGIWSSASSNPSKLFQKYGQYQINTFIALLNLFNDDLQYQIQILTSASMLLSQNAKIPNYIDLMELDKIKKENVKLRQELLNSRNFINEMQLRIAYLDNELIFFNNSIFGKMRSAFHQIFRK